VVIEPKTVCGVVVVSCSLGLSEIWGFGQKPPCCGAYNDISYRPSDRKNRNPSALRRRFLDSLVLACDSGIPWRVVDTDFTRVSSPGPCCTNLRQLVLCVGLRAELCFCWTYPIAALILLSFRFLAVFGFGVHKKKEHVRYFIFLVCVTSIECIYDVSVFG
ncbi:unnamed protein product, partial [Ectocarpus sp. 6 AP-2014]